MSHYQLGHFRRLSTRSLWQRRRRLRACTHISPDIGADIKRLLNKFKLIDKHTESQMVAASAAAADGNYRHVLCSNQRSSRHLVKQFAGQMQPNQSRQRMRHAACHIAQVQPTHCPPVDRSGPVQSCFEALSAAERNGARVQCRFCRIFSPVFYFIFFFAYPP